MKVGILLSVREKATRLPGKVLKPLAGAPSVTEHLLKRLAGAALTEEVVLATSTEPGDDILEQIAISNGFAFFRGSADDKLIRYRDAALKFGFDFIVVVDGDDPFVSVSHIDRIIEHAEKNGGDYIIFAGLPVGATGFGLSVDGLQRVCANRAEENTEVWASYYLNDQMLQCTKLDETNPQWLGSDIRMTLDYPEDFEFFTRVADGLAIEGLDTSFENVMDHLKKFPAIIEINSGVQEAYEFHLARSAN